MLHDLQDHPRDLASLLSDLAQSFEWHQHVRIRFRLSSEEVKSILGWCQKNEVVWATVSQDLIDAGRRYLLYEPQATSTVASETISVSDLGLDLFLAAPVALLVTDEAGMIIQANEAMEQLSGYSAGELTNVFIGQLFPSALLPSLIQRHEHQSGSQTTDPILITLLRKDRQIAVVSAATRLVNASNGATVKVSTFRDQTLEYSADLLNLHLQGCPGGVPSAPNTVFLRTLIEDRADGIQVIRSFAIWDYNPSENTVFRTEGFKTLFNLEHGTQTYTLGSMNPYVHPDDAERVAQSLKRFIETPSAQFWHEEYRTGTVTAGFKHVSDGAIAMRHPDGTCYRVVGIANDVSEQRKLERVQREASKLAKIGFWEVDLNTNELYWSDEVKRIHEVDQGFKPDVRTAIRFYKEGWSRDQIQAHFGHAVAHGESYDLELIIVTDKGNERWVRSMGQPTLVQGKCIRMSGSFQDIDDFKRSQLTAERQHRHLELISEVGQRLLDIDHLEEVIQYSLTKLAQVVSCDRLYVFDVVSHQNEVHRVSQRYEWCAPGIEPQLNHPMTQNVDYAIARDDVHQLMHTAAIHLFKRTCKTEYFKAVFDEQGIKTILLLGLVHNGQLIGFLGLDNCREEVEWPEDEVALLATISDSFATAIAQRNALNAVEDLLEERAEILDGINDGFAALDHKLNIIYVNKSAEDYLGANLDALIGMPLDALFPREEYPDSYTNYERAINEHVQITFTTYIEEKNAWMELSVYPTNRGISVFFRDVSHAKRAELEIQASNERFERIGEVTQDAIWDWDLNSSKLFWGRGFKLLFGYDQDRFPPNIERWEAMVHPDDAKRVSASLNAALENPKTSKWVEEYRFKKNDGSYCFVIDRGGIIRNEAGTPTRMVGTMQDITAAKAYEEALVKLNKQLAHQKLELEASNKELEQFAYVASHDLQEPLRMVSSFLTQIERRYSDKLDDRGKEYIHYAVDGSKRMRQIILDLLNYSRLSRFDHEPERIDLNELMAHVINLHQHIIDELNAEIHVDQMPTVYAFKAPMTQLFQNLIGNALKYHQPGLAPKISITYESTADELNFSISDNGIGIKPEYHDRIFGIFQRLHNQRDYQGTGIGLSIVKKIVDQTGGRIEIESDGKSGSIFRIFLPASLLEIKPQN